MAKTFENDLVELCEKAHAMAKSKGFYDKPKTLTENIVLIAGEVGEMVEAHRKGDAESAKIPGITESEEEAADVIIRIMDTVGYVLTNESHDYIRNVKAALEETYEDAYESFSENLLNVAVWQINWRTVLGAATACYSLIGDILDHAAYTDVANGETYSLHNQMGMMSCLATIVAILETLFPNIRLAVEAKMQYNSGRPRLHGKKY